VEQFTDAIAHANQRKAKVPLEERKRPVTIKKIDRIVNTKRIINLAEEGHPKELV